MASKNQNHSIQIASLNVNGLVAAGKAEPLFRYLASSKIDLFLLQETYVHTEEIKERIAKLRNGNSCWNLGKPMSCGLAVLFSPRLNPSDIKHVTDMKEDSKTYQSL